MEAWLSCFLARIHGRISIKRSTVDVADGSGCSQVRFASLQFLGYNSPFQEKYSAHQWPWVTVSVYWCDPYSQDPWLFHVLHKTWWWQWHVCVCLYMTYYYELWTYNSHQYPKHLLSMEPVFRDNPNRTVIWKPSSRAFPPVTPPVPSTHHRSSFLWILCCQVLAAPSMKILVFIAILVADASHTTL